MNIKNLKPLLFPGGALLLLASLALNSGLFAISPPAVNFYYSAVFIAGFALSWRFHSSRTFFALLSLFLVHRALEFFSVGHIAAYGPSRIALEVTAFLLPVNFAVFCFVRERGFAIPVISPRLLLLFMESVFVALVCRPGVRNGPALFHSHFLGWSLFLPVKIPHAALLIFVCALALLAYRVVLLRKPVESGMFWSLLTAGFALQKGAVGATASAYFATAGLILVAAIIENSYVLAYHDELTSLPGRRAFNEALLTLQSPFAVAVVDIDHFKGFNDTYGHDTGDQVLRLVAGKLARVTGGGKPFRVGGEEFNILFAGSGMKEALPHLEVLRTKIEHSRFHVRDASERRVAQRGPDRRKNPAKSRKMAATAVAPIRNPADGLSVTVSIGVAEPASASQPPQDVIEAADQALYRAKRGGRNRVETTEAKRVSRPRKRLA